MKALFLIAKDNIKKKKTNAVIMILLIAIATMFLYVGISVIGNCNKVIDACNEKNNGADFFYFSESVYYQEIIDLVCENEHVIESCQGEFLYADNAYYGKDEIDQKDGNESSFIFEKRDEGRNISKHNMIDAKGEWTENSVVLPYYMHVANGYEAGDTFVIETEGVKIYCTVYGFVEDVMFSNPMTMTTTKIVISDAIYERLRPVLKLYRGVRARLDGYDTEQFDKVIENEIQQLMVEKDAVGTNYHISLNYDVMKSGTGTLVMIFMAMLTVFAVLLILVVLIIIRFNIGNSIEENIKNIGIMEACGYTSKQMICAVVLEFSILGIVGTALGLVIANACSKALGNIIASAMGLLWNVGFSLVSAILTVAAILAFILLIARVSAKKYKKISPLDALRNGIYSHNFKKNSLRLEKSPLPLNASLGVKSTLFNLKKNIFITIVVVILTFVTCMAFAIFKNFSNMSTMLPIVGVEYTDIMLVPKDNEYNQYEEMSEKIKQRNEVENVLTLTSYSVILSVNGEEEQIHVDAYDHPDEMRIDILAKGRMPIYDNEVVLSTLMCNKFDLDIGDVITLKLGETEGEYIIVGKNQGATNLGKTCVLTMEGNKRLISDNNGSGLYVYLKEDADIDEVLEEYKTLFGDDFSVSNYRKLVDAVVLSMSLALKIFCILLVVVSAFVIAMILLLLIKSHIIREKKQLGIYKALGYTTGQLILQIVLSFLPVMLIGGIIGGVVTKLLVNKLFVLCFSMFSIEKLVFEIPVAIVLLCIVGIVVWSEIIALLASVKIRKIAPYKMITEA